MAFIETGLYFLIAFSLFAFGCVEAWSAAILEVAVFTLAAGHLLRKERVEVSMLTLPLILAAAAIAVLGLLQALDPRAVNAPANLAPFTNFKHGTFQTSLQWICYALILWLAPVALKDAPSARRFIWFLISLGAILAAIGIIQISQDNVTIYGLRKINHDNYHGRWPFGPLYNRHHAANWLSLSMTLGLGMFFSQFFTHNLRRWGTAADFAALQALLLTVFGLILYAILTTYTRGVAVSFAGAVLATVGMALHFFAPPAWARPAKAAFLAAAAALLLFFIFGLRWRDISPGTIGLSLSYRRWIWSDALKIFKDFPLWGSGLGSYAQSVIPYQNIAIHGAVQHAHNDWLELLSTGGIAGLGAYALGFAWSLKKIIACWKNTANAERMLLAGAGIAAILLFALHGLADFSFQTPANAVLFLCVVAWTAALFKQPSLFYSFSLRPPLRAAGLAGLMALSVLAARPGLADWRDFSAQKAPAGAKIALLEKAVRLNPDNPKHHVDLAYQYVLRAEHRSRYHDFFLRTALSHAQRAQRLDPANPYGFAQGAILWRMNRVDDAKALIKKSRDFKPWLK